MAPVSGTGGGQIRTGPTGKLPEIDRRTGVYFVPWCLGKTKGVTKCWLMGLLVDAES